ncbi:MAG: hypothetical protein M3R67_12365 [Acidobacteriota bacterium]|nr:hypothetical protein [Acidobacteriota bacterium]
MASVLVFCTAQPASLNRRCVGVRDFNLGAAAAYGVVLNAIIGLIMIVEGGLERLNKESVS